MPKGEKRTLPALAALGDSVDLARAAAEEALGPNRTPTEIAASLDEAIRALDESLPLLSNDAELCAFGRKTARQLLAAYTVALLEMADCLRSRVKGGVVTTKDLVVGIEALGRQVENLRLRGALLPGVADPMTAATGTSQPQAMLDLDAQIRVAQEELAKLTKPEQ